MPDENDDKQVKLKKKKPPEGFVPPEPHYTPPGKANPLAALLARAQNGPPPNLPDTDSKDGPLIAMMEKMGKTPEEIAALKKDMQTNYGSSSGVGMESEVGGDEVNAWFKETAMGELDALGKSLSDPTFKAIIDARLGAGTADRLAAKNDETKAKVQQIPDAPDA